MNITEFVVLYPWNPELFFAQASVGGAAIGLSLGLVPYLVGRMKGSRKLGTIALCLCTVSGLALGALLAIPVAVAFSVTLLIGEDTALNKALSQSARGNIDLLHEIINSGGEPAEEKSDSDEHADAAENPEPEDRKVSYSEDSSHRRRPLVENLFS